MRKKGAILNIIVALLTILPCLGAAQVQDRGPAAQRAREEGRKAAAEDLKRGELTYHVGGPPAPWDERFAQILWDEYQIRLRRDGCDPNDEQFQRGIGSNEVMMPAIAGKYGRDALGKAEERAKQEVKDKAGTGGV